MYLIGIIIMVIGILPLMFSKFLFEVFKGTPLSKLLAIFMILLFIWQINSGILYFRHALSLETIELIYKATRISVFFFTPICIYIIYIIFQDDLLIAERNRFLEKMISLIVNKVTFTIALISSSVLYILNWTMKDIFALQVESLIFSENILYLAPIQGPMYIYFLLFQSIVAVIVGCVSLIILKRIDSKTTKEFMYSFIGYWIGLLLSALINLQIPELGNLISSMLVIIFSVGLMISFFKLYLQNNEERTDLLIREKKMDYLGSISSSLIHEIRNPIHHIKNFAHIIDTTEKLNSDSKEYMNYIYAATNQLEDVVNNFNRYIKQDEQSFETVDVNDLIDKAIYFTSKQAKYNNVTVLYNKKFERLKIQVNSTNIIQVLMNVLKNGIDAIPSSNQNRLIQIDVSTDKKELVFIDIIDTGKGIPKDKWEDIFNPFISYKKDGMGIGLPYSQKVLYEHHGMIQIIDSTKEGTHFRIQLPKHQLY